MTAPTKNHSYDSDAMSDALTRLQQESPGLLCKGIPQSFKGTFSDVAAAGFFIGDCRLPMPVAVLRESAIGRNRRWMTEFVRSAGVDFAPHGKTSLAPDIFRMQMEDGVWGLTAANAQQLAFFADLGIRRVILANQLVGAGNIEAFLDCTAAYPDLDAYLLVDSPEALSALSSAHARRCDAAPLKILIELGIHGGRTGIRTLEDAVMIARLADRTPGLLLAGVECYEGIVPGDDQVAREAAVGEMMAKICTLARICEAENLWGTDEVVLTAGGTEFFDLTCSGLTGVSGTVPYRVVIRSGCYITYDSAACDRSFDRIFSRSAAAAGIRLPRPEAALEVWAVIQSMPEPGLAFATLGKRDVSYDWDMPVPLRWLRPGQTEAPSDLTSDHKVIRLNDQHAYIEIPAGSPLVVGDLVGFGISHACTTFDKWRSLLTVDDAYRVTGAIRTFF